MRVFLDSNVLVSGFATRGLSSDLIRQVFTEHEFMTGEVVLAIMDPRGFWSVLRPAQP